MPDLAVIDMSPPQRLACRRLSSRVVVQADGSVTACDQDARGEPALGRLTEQSLGEIWLGSRMQSLRAAHERGEYGVMRCVQIVGNGIGRERPCQPVSVASATASSSGSNALYSSSVSALIRAVARRSGEISGRRP